jgi:microcin C transport system substrate-binding protein
MIKLFLTGALALCVALPALAENAPVPAVRNGLHGLAMHGDPAYGQGFSHFAYTNPDAPKGGAIHLGGFGGFDNLNPFILKGEAAEGLSLMYDTLMMGSADEAFSQYGLLAESVDLPDDRSWVAFTLRPEAKFSDGTPVTADDVVWTFKTLMEKGSPYFRAYYSEVTGAVAESPRRVKFTFKGPGNRELPLIVGQMAVLPKHYWDGKDFSASTLETPIGSGPYRLGAVQAGRSITYDLRPDYWGKDLPVNRGRYNISHITYDYYKDLEVMFEAFKAGEIDFRLENVARNWATGYDLPAVKEGRIRKELIPHQDPQGMQGFFMNTRRPVFSDVRVRHALSLLLDFEWLNKNLFHNQYTRSTSFFANSELASSGVAAADEVKLLEPFKDQLPPEVFTAPFALPVTAGDGNQRDQLRQAVEMLKGAGWELKNGVMTNTQSGQPFTFEILLVQDNFIRVTQPLVKALERIGIKAAIRVIDTAQYQNRLNDFDYDMIVGTASQSLSPGNEQTNYWGSLAADLKGSSNFAGVKSPVVDALITKIVQAPDRPSLLTAVHALDRVLLNGYYVIPQWHMAAHRVAYWNRFSHPEVLQKYGFGFPDVWWVDAAKDAALKRTNR